MLHRLNADERVYRYTAGRPPAPDETKAQLARYRTHWDEHGFGVWALEEKATSRLVGRVGLSYHRLWPPDPELGWMLEPDVWGRGYATEAAAAALHHGFAARGFALVVSIVHPQNERSFAVARRLAMQPWSTVPWDDTGITLQVWAIGRGRAERPG